MPGLFDVQKLLAWYRENARDLPWRRTKDPWAILVAEVVLQQTRVEQATPYYERILTRFPTPEALAEAPLEELLKLWQGLGYYRRAENLWRAAREIAQKGFPRTFDGLRRLPGLGPYTAAAVAAFAFDEPVPAIDGNVRRVLSRYFALERSRQKELFDLARPLVAAEPAETNQALIELGATLCTPKNPSCPRCPLKAGCRGQAEPGRYPAPVRKRPRKVRLFALALRAPGGWVLTRREAGILRGLWGFPLDENEGALLARYRVKAARPLGDVRHQLTHRTLEVRVLFSDHPGPGEDPATRPLSRLDEKILALLKERLG